MTVFVGQVRAVYVLAQILLLFPFVFLITLIELRLPGLAGGFVTGFKVSMTILSLCAMIVLGLGAIS
jgi:hypothetical protein